MSKGKVVPQVTHRTRNTSQVLGLGSVELCWYKACLSPTHILPDAIGLEWGEKSTVHSTVPAATAIHGAFANATPASSGTAAGWKERMQCFQEGCSTHAFLRMNGTQVQLQKTGWSKEFSLATHFRDKHVSSSVCRQELNHTKPVVFKCRKPNSLHLVEKLSASE